MQSLKRFLFIFKVGDLIEGQKAYKLKQKQVKTKKKQNQVNPSKNKTWPKVEVLRVIKIYS